MIPYYDDYFQYEPEPSYQYQPPSYGSPYQELQTVEGEGQYYSLPVGPTVSPYQELTTRPGEGQYFGLPVGPGAVTDYSSGVSRVGPAASVMPRGPAGLGVPVGSLFAGPRYGFGGFGGFAQAFKSPRALSRALTRAPYQRSFSVEPQERLRGGRRKKRR